ncbi:MAG: 2-oxo acid dehydrogenase subunit E2, partial [Thermoplasmata archaeon]|nr:2-oxo acid dehydrogenase subunit E2 [Thermoplasmata archaeon]
KVVKRGESMEERDFLRFLISVDHDIIDGAPLARFSSKLVGMLENAALLD